MPDALGDMHYYAHTQIRVSEEKQAFSVFLFSARYWIIARYVHRINSELMQEGRLLQTNNHLTYQLKKENQKTYCHLVSHWCLPVGRERGREIKYSVFNIQYLDIQNYYISPKL